MKALTNRRFPLGSTALILFLLGFFIRIQGEIRHQARLRLFRLENPEDVDASLAAIQETSALLEKDAFWSNGGLALMGVGLVLAMVWQAERSRLRRHKAAVVAANEAMAQVSRRKRRR